MPYAFRSYYPPAESAEKGKFDTSAYSAELHQENIKVLNSTLETFGSKDQITPWLTTGTGVVAVQASGLKIDFASVYLADDRMAYRQGIHFVRQDVRVHQNKGIKARSRVYPTFSRVVGLLTSSDAAWSMMYPTINHDPEGASKMIQNQLKSRHDLEIADKESLADIFPVRKLARKYWVGVR